MIRLLKQLFEGVCQGLEVTTAHEGESVMQDVMASGVKAIPPVYVTSAWLSGVDLPHSVMALTLVYTALQIFVLVRDRILSRK